MDTLLTSGQAAARMGVHRSCMSRWENKGLKIPTTITLGGHRRYSMLMIDAMHERMKTRQGATSLIEFETTGGAE